jgi:transcriptional regulator with XRE-family HTH domain
MLRIRTAASARPAFADRPPVLDALRALGLTDAKIARALGCTSEFIAAWRNGKKPIPHKTHAALIFLVGRLTGQIGRAVPPRTTYARRAQVAIEAATLWSNLARNEFAEALGTDDPGRDYPELAADAFELGQRALARLEKADAS